MRNQSLVCSDGYDPCASARGSFFFTDAASVRIEGDAEPGQRQHTDHRWTKAQNERCRHGNADNDDNQGNDNSQHPAKRFRSA